MRRECVSTHDKLWACPGCLGRITYVYSVLQLSGLLFLRKKVAMRLQ